VTPTTPKPRAATTTTPGATAPAQGTSRNRPRVAIVRIALKGGGTRAHAAQVRARGKSLASVGVEGRAIDAPCRSVVVSFARKVGGHHRRVRRVTDKLHGGEYKVRANRMRAGRYRVTVSCATVSAKADFVVAG
jgi:hypothetical protein